MKIKHLLIINIFLILIILINFVFKNDSKKYIFNRNFKESEFRVVKSYNTENKYFSAPSNLIALYKKQSNSENQFVEGKFLTLDENFTEKSTFKFQINKNFNPVILNISKNLLYTQNWKLYLNNKLISDKIKVVNAIFLNKEKILFLGEYYDGNGFNFGFFYFDLNTKTIEKLNIIRSDSLSFFPKLFLQYTGNFKKYENKIVYVNEKSSNAWVIENTEISEFATKDKTPLPTIINSDNNYYYERGKTYNTNSDFFLTEKNVCVFSNRTENKNEIVIDLYKYNGKYVNNS